jgi:hypothetical protein
LISPRRKSRRASVGREFSAHCGKRNQGKFADEPGPCDHALDNAKKSCRISP